MSIVHHPDPATLMSFAAGTLSEGFSAVVASHAQLCSTCRCEMRKLEMLGGLLMERSKPVATNQLQPDVPEHALQPKLEIPADRVLPRAISRLVGGGIDRVVWSSVAPGVQQAKLPLSAGSGGLLMLLKIGAGRRIPEHGHGGAELTLVLTGRYSDKMGQFSRGDIADLDEDVEHQPIVDPDGECICLIASETKVRFKGVLPRLLQPMIGV